MLDVQSSLANLQWTVDHHFLHIQNQHPFMRAWAVQFELAYTDFRVIQLALQLAGEHDLLAQFTKIYDQLYTFEYAFAADGLEGFNAKFGDQLTTYADTVKAFDAIIPTIAAHQVTNN
ncbi:hypothetical protein [Lacticaseibacillus mingshuiensis]|uniref:Thiaminase II n=1 Tax=Lacticaseibacillus mingshuiensis TaxID=2799574 RepID=A0ABW4CMA1_9LACO|nr:hypothetical protein [Lacticaseibacillus mingshuiensis]